MAFSHSRIIEGRQINRNRSGTMVVELYRVVDNGPGGPDAAVAYMETQFPVDTPHPVWGGDAIVSGIQLVNPGRSAAFIIAVVYQSPSVLIGGVTTKQIRSRSELFYHDLLFANSKQQTESGDTVPLEMTFRVPRVRKTIQRTFYVGAFGEDNVNAVLRAEGDYAGKTCEFPLPPSQTREPAVLLFTSADVYSDSENRLFATYNFTTLQPRAAESIAIAGANPIVLEVPALEWLDEFEPPYLDATLNQYVIGVRTAESMYGAPFEAVILPGVQGT